MAKRRSPRATMSERPSGSGWTETMRAAVPMRSGYVAAALVLSANPRLSPAGVKFALQLTAQHMPNYGLIEQGAGEINVALAVELAQAQGGNAKKLKM